MKLSELLAENPHLDQELDLDDGDLVLDGVYLFRVINQEHEPGAGRVLLHGAPGTDGVVARGLVTVAMERHSSEWPVHICEGHD